MLDTAQDRLDPRDEFDDAERLGEIVVRAGLEAEHTIHLHRTGG